MNPKITIALLLLLPAFLFAQKTSSWRDHFDFSQGVAALDVQGQTVYVATAGLVFNEENGHISKASGLSDFGLSAACYDPHTASVYVGYSNGNLDVLHSIVPRQIRNGGYTKNITAWKNFVTHGRKTITCFLRVGDRMLVGTASQILEVKNDEILANYSIDENNDSLAIIQLALLGDTIAALTSKGVYAIHKDHAQRYYYPSWRKSTLAVSPPPAPFIVPNAPAAPQSNQTLALDEHNGTVVALSNGAISVLKPKGTWRSLAHAGLAGAAEPKVNPKNPAQILVATSSGVAEVSVGDVALTFAGKGLSGADVRTLACDREHSFFAFASQSATPVHLRNADGSWVSVPCEVLKNTVLSSAVFAGASCWGIANGRSLFAYTPGADLAGEADDRASVFAVSILNNETLAVGNSYALSPDRYNALWLGTDKGILTYAASSDPASATPTCDRIRIPDDITGMAAYVLEHERVTAVAIDGANRKWLGTRDAGIFLQGSDGRDRLQLFNAQNSPLPSNNVLDIAVNTQTGEVLIATDRGLVGYMGDATAGKSTFDQLKIFPNPVRPNMSLVTITNLVEDASVKITDVSGNLVFTGTANGGTITWDVRNLSGRRVATGVYLVFLSDSTGDETRVAKVMVVN